MLSATQVRDLEVEYAFFNAERTLSTADAPDATKRDAGALLLIAHPSRPASTYMNRILGITEATLPALDVELQTYAGFGSVPRIDVRSEDGTPNLLAGLQERGYRQAGSLAYLTRDVEGAGSVPARHRVRRWTAADAGAYLDLLERSTGSAISPETRAAKQPFYCTDRFRVFVAELERRPAAWATLYVSANQKHGYLANAFTVPDCRGRGLQQALIAARLRDAAALALDAVVTDVVPDTASERNCRRAGFEIASVHLLWERPSA